MPSQIIAKGKGFDIRLMDIFRDSNCAIRIKVKNNSKTRLKSDIINNTKILISGVISCRSGERYPYSRGYPLPNFLKIPGKIETIYTDLYINTENNCFTELKAELVYNGKPLNDDILFNNTLSRDFGGPCEYKFIR